MSRFDRNEQYFKQLTVLVVGVGLLGACSEEPRVRSTTEFLENPIMLEAAMVRCAVDRDKTRYDSECINARQAVVQIEAKEEAARRAELEARSDSKRRALRRAQAAAAEARRRSAEARRLREEAEYLAQFGVVPPANSGDSPSGPESGNTPTAVIPESSPAEVGGARSDDFVPASDGGNAPVISDRSPEEAPTDLASIRDELQRRSDEGDN